MQAAQTLMTFLLFLTDLSVIVIQSGDIKRGIIRNTTFVLKVIPIT